ncbi:zinc finger protein 830 [Phlebotomus argentipes]|uniref:zinc finger protein 830 n=1 Tax=Phlebotomus argentipes TaxID=94469 RepID=UPI0028936F0E|nr:zinc finger protein 830 [Phlebotomus argentipes]
MKMSATFRLAKQKYSQNDLRRLMNEQKQKSQKDRPKIDSPLAKYNELGQLTCILCQSVVRSEDVWKVHINAKVHKENVEKAKKLKEDTQNFQMPAKRPAPPSASADPQPAKKLKGILKNPNPPSQGQQVVSGGEKQPSNSLPSDFFDSSKGKSKSQTPDKAQDAEEKMDAEPAAKEETLPEGFFDDPVKDAKARNQEYKDPVEEEWEKFQREIRDAATESNAIIAEDQEESTAERQIVEIDEQIRNWSRVLEIQRKKEATAAELELSKNRNMDVDDNSSSEGEEAEEFDEFVDWRSKKSHR